MRTLPHRVSVFHMDFGKAVFYTIVYISCLNSCTVTILLLSSSVNFPEVHCLKKLCSAKISFIFGS